MTTPRSQLIPDGENEFPLTRWRWFFIRVFRGVMNTECDAYWAFADEIPLAEVVAYWCEKSGFTHEHCRAAKRSAIVAACKSGVVKYGRSDGKSFIDPPDMLAGLNVLTIDRNSFDTWVTENFEDTSPIPDKPLGTTERATLLKLVIGMAIKGYNHDPAASKSTSPKEIADDLAALGMTITDDTVRKYLKQAALTVLPTKPPQP